MIIEKKKKNVEAKKFSKDKTKKARKRRRKKIQWCKTHCPQAC